MSYNAGTRGIHFPRNYNGFIEIYTDGACSDNGNENALAAIGVFIADNHSENVSRVLSRRGTNIIAELEAVFAGISIVRKFQLDNVIIYTDSEFVVKGLYEWMPDWIRRGWRTASGQAVCYKQEFQTLDKETKRLGIQLQHVRGHSGIYGNEQADKLAKKALSDFMKRNCA